MNLSHEEPTSIRYAVDEYPSHSLSAGLGLQVVVLILAGIVITPIIVLRAAGEAEGYMGSVVFAALFVSGLTTVIQARPIGPVGAG
jgi:xanthine/uracil permease